ncbi:MAG: cytochrome c-type biogenesis protein [Solirubrobacteraceae bacterium]
MRRSLALASLLLLALLAAAAPAGAAPASRVSLPDVEDEVMCVQCGTALNISQAPSADQERAVIREDIAKGLTKDQIKAHLVHEYGRNVLAEPPKSGFDLAAWLVPGLLAILAIGAMALTARRWRRAGERPEDDEDPALDVEDARRVERDMAGYDL